MWPARTGTGRCGSSVADAPSNASSPSPRWTNGWIGSTHPFEALGHGVAVPRRRRRHPRLVWMPAPDSRAPQSRPASVSPERRSAIASGYGGRGSGRRCRSRASQGCVLRLAARQARALAGPPRLLPVDRGGDRCVRLVGVAPGEAAGSRGRRTSPGTSGTTAWPRATHEPLAAPVTPKVVSLRRGVALDELRIWHVIRLDDEGPLHGSDICHGRSPASPVRRSMSAAGCRQLRGGPLRDTTLPRSAQPATAGASG